MELTYQRSFAFICGSKLLLVLTPSVQTAKPAEISNAIALPGGPCTRVRHNWFRKAFTWTSTAAAAVATVG
jgi:hypothetical protein